MKFSTIIACAGLCATLANASKYLMPSRYNEIEEREMYNEENHNGKVKKDKKKKKNKKDKKNKNKGYTTGKKHKKTKTYSETASVNVDDTTVDNKYAVLDNTSKATPLHSSLSTYARRYPHPEPESCKPGVSTSGCLSISTRPENSSTTDKSPSSETASVNVDDALLDAPVDPKERAVDDPKYEKCGAPKMSDDGNMPEVSVCGDATYRLNATVALADVCSGSGDTPTGTVCPTALAETTLACRPNIMSWYTGAQMGKTGTCVAPEPATCQKLLTGAWGCVFPGNCNTRNACLGEEACSDEYVKDEDGKCVLGPNEYPVPNAEYTGAVDTNAMDVLPIASTEYSTYAGAAAMAVSGIIGLATAGTFVLSML